MKKLLLTLSTIALTTAPMVTVVACGSNTDSTPTVPDDGGNGSGGADGSSFTEVTDQDILDELNEDHNLPSVERGWITEQIQESTHHMAGWARLQERGIYLPNETIYEIARNNNDPSGTPMPLVTQDYLSDKDDTYIVGDFLNDHSEEDTTDNTWVEKDGKYFYEYRHGDDNYVEVNGEKVYKWKPFENASTWDHLYFDGNPSYLVFKEWDTQLFANYVIWNKSAIDNVLLEYPIYFNYWTTHTYLHEDGYYRIPAEYQVDGEPY